MTDQKHTKEPLKVGDKVWVEMNICGFNPETGYALVSHDRVIGFIPALPPSEMCADSPLDLRRQRDELREAVNALLCLPEVHSDWSISIWAKDILTKTKGSV